MKKPIVLSDVWTISPEKADDFRTPDTKIYETVYK